MRRTVPGLMVTVAVLFFAWEVYAAVRWLGETGGAGPAFDHFWSTLSSDWMARIVLSDHLVIAGVVLVALWIDARRIGWLLKRRLLLAIAFVALGSPTLLVYLAWRMESVERSGAG